LTSHQSKTGLALIVLTLLTGCSPEPDSQSTPSPIDSHAATTQIQTPGAPELDQIGNATFSGLYQHPITLTDGRWEGEPYAAGGASRPPVGLIPGSYLIGDLDGDGAAEAVVMLWQSSGGSGVFSHLATFVWRNGEIVNTGVAPIGDRVQVRSARIDDEQIILDVIQQGPGDAACCPSQKATRHWSLSKDKLLEGQAQLEGQLTLADIDEKEWQLVQFDRNGPLPESVQVTLQIDGDRLAGRGPCNRYFAGVEAGNSPGEIKIGQSGATRMACPDPLMPLEQKYLKLLAGVNRYGFMMGKLALSWQSESKHGTMLFTLENQATKSNDADNPD